MTAKVKRASDDVAGEGQKAPNLESLLAERWAFGERPAKLVLMLDGEPVGPAGEPFHLMVWSVRSPQGKRWQSNWDAAADLSTEEQRTAARLKATVEHLLAPEWRIGDPLTGEVFDTAFDARLALQILTNHPSIALDVIQRAQQSRAFLGASAIN